MSVGVLRTAAPPEGEWALIALGSNLPFRGQEPAQILTSAVEALPASGMTVLRSSRLWVSPAWPDATDPPFVNAVVLVRCPGLAAAEALRSLLALEGAFGRSRGARNAPRTLDLDLLDHWAPPPASEALTLPHARMHSRDFVLGPLSEAAPWWRHRRLGAAAAELLGRLAAPTAAPIDALRN